ncbi:glycosyltransferase family 4 protein [Pseudanabaena sp. FACHB-2040]|nr:glycosyltransferase family 4 protein [Pseudanabaena sp. FACHB-2040]
MKVALVHEWLVSHAGSEKVVEQVLECFPSSDIFCLVDFLQGTDRNFLGDHQVYPSVIQRLPLAQRHFRQYLPLMPLAIERFDLSDYNLVLSSHHAVAKGVLTRADQLHISYVHTPLRYGWDLQHQYLQQSGLNRGLKGWVTQVILHYLRLWDVASANRVDCFVANSRYVARRIWKTYRRPAQVIYPPVETTRFVASPQRDDFYLTVSRCVPYKRLDLTVAAFNQLGLPLVVIGDGPGLNDLRSQAKPNIHFLGHQPDSAVEDHMSRCKAFVFPAEEDFGIAIVEAQAAGAPVIAFGRGGATETVMPGKTGLLFPSQTVPSLMEWVQAFEAGQFSFSSEQIQNHAEKFSVERFRREFKTFVEAMWRKFEQGEALEMH